MPKVIKRAKKKIVKKVIKKEKKVVLQSPKGMHDVLPQDQPWWNKIRKATDEVADFYNFSRIETPILENSAVFEKGTGGNTDIVEKEMFVLKTKGGDKLALRPENTPGIMRAYVEHGLSRLAQPLKLYSFGPFFRYERPQAGRYRQFYQIGFEIIGGDDDPLYDAQTISIAYQIVQELKIKNIIIQINSIGCKSCRSAYRRRLQDYYRRYESKICKDCRRRLTVNPLRLLDCKNEICLEIKSGAPMTVNHLCQVCKSHFKSVLEYLDEINAPYTLTPYLVRGLDYYNRTVFELADENNLSFALGGGGRYDYLGEMMGLRKN
ncbi:histidine--tRNA ligase, partial [Candidatus Wolfebacteria bacterium]|nr:histidine--tRNA ligase [Candidatus Wolfebacteria bacterium]